MPTIVTMSMTLYNRRNRYKTIIQTISYIKYIKLKYWVVILDFWFTYPCQTKVTKRLKPFKIQNYFIYKMLVKNKRLISAQRLPNSLLGKTNMLIFSSWRQSETNIIKRKRIFSFLYMYMQKTFIIKIFC